VHPGYFFDFETDGYVVISLLTEPRIFDEGVRRLLSAVPR
jgi:alanine-synthesizing transaminase